MTTMQVVVDRARIPLNDAKSGGVDTNCRTKDTEILGYANVALHRAFQIRPDLKFGSYSTPFVDLAIGATFPLPDRYTQAVADYATGRANVTQMEESDTARAASFMALFEGLMRK
jgi:hypothetical protein